MEGFSGVLVSDAFSGYHALENRRPEIRVAHCWARARRDFADALKAFKKTGPSKQRVKKTVAFQALERIGTFYRLEDEWKDLAPEERLIRRQELLKPLAEAYFAWVKSIDPDTVVSANAKDGLKYSVNQEARLKVFLENGAVPIDNSASERAIRPFRVGRSNWRVMDSVKGAEVSAIVYSVVETAKANRLKPYEYPRHLLTEIPNAWTKRTRLFWMTFFRGLTPFLTFAANLLPKTRRGLDSPAGYFAPYRLFIAYVAALIAVDKFLRLCPR